MGEVEPGWEYYLDMQVQPVKASPCRRSRTITRRRKGIAGKAHR